MIGWKQTPPTEKGAYWVRSKTSMGGKRLVRVIGKGGRKDGDLRIEFFGVNEVHQVHERDDLEWLFPKIEAPE